MSRNIGSNCCSICDGEVELVDPKAFRNKDNHWGFSSDAFCLNCGALYKAEVQNPIVDLCFRHSMNDEPYALDLPSLQRMRELGREDYYEAYRNRNVDK